MFFFLFSDSEMAELKIRKEKRVVVIEDHFVVVGKHLSSSRHPKRTHNVVLVFLDIVFVPNEETRCPPRLMDVSVYRDNRPSLRYLYKHGTHL